MNAISNFRLHNRMALLAIGIIGLQATPMFAALLVQNPSFESPVISAPGYATVTPTDWSAIDPDNNRRIINKNFGNVAPLVPANVTGDQVAIIGVSTTTPGSGTDLFQNIGTTDATTNLTLTVDAARRADLAEPAHDFTIGIWTDTNSDSVPDQLLGTPTVVLAASLTTTFQPFSASALAIPSGTQVYIRFTVADATAADFLNNPDHVNQDVLDNVQINAIAVPEPTGALGLACVAATALLRRRNS